MDANGIASRVDAFAPAALPAPEGAVAYVRRFAQSPETEPVFFMVLTEHGHNLFCDQGFFLLRDEDGFSGAGLVEKRGTPSMTSRIKIAPSSSLTCFLSATFSCFN